MRWCRAQPHAIMHLESQNHNLNDRGDEIASTPAKKEYCFTERADRRAGRRLDRGTTSVEEESTERCLTTRAADTENERTAGREEGSATVSFSAAHLQLSTPPYYNYHGGRVVVVGGSLESLSLPSWYKRCSTRGVAA